MTLDDLGLMYGTDKASNHHGYLDIYEREISKEPKGSLLELGWEAGASVKMWRDWLPGWTITGLDREPKDAIEGVNFVYGEQDDPDVLWATGMGYGPFDVVIDDASHEPTKTMTSFHLLWPHVKPGGLYFVEDTETFYIHHWGGDPMGEAFKAFDRVVRGQPEAAEVTHMDELTMVRKAW